MAGRPWARKWAIASFVVAGACLLGLLAAVVSALRVCPEFGLSRAIDFILALFALFGAVVFGTIGFALRRTNLVARAFGALERSAEPCGVSWEPEIREFEAQDRASPPPAGAVIFVGSSSIRLWTSLAADMAPLAVVNRGFGGSTMADVLQYAKRIVMPCRPRAAVIYEGDNDINRGASPAQVAAGAEELAGMLSAALPGVRLFFMGIKPSPSRVPLWPKFVRASRLLEEFCRRAGHVYIDVAPGMLDASGRPRPELYVGDGLHMTTEGYRVWTSAVRPVLMQHLGGSGL